MTADQRLCAGWIERIQAEVARGYDPATRTGKKIASHVGWALNFLMGLGITAWSEITAEDTRDWYYADVRNPDGTYTSPEENTARNRQWMLTIAFETAAELGALIDPVELAGPKIQQRPGPDTAARPLDDDEDQRICAYANPGAVPSMRSAVVAVMRAGGSAPDTAAVRVADVDLDNATIGFADGRVCALDTWSANAIGEYLAANPSLEPTDKLCVNSNAAPERAAETVTAQIWKVIAAAGFGRCPGVSGRSLRLTAARRAFESAGIEAAARLLGSPSLDSTARAIGYSWQHETTKEPLGHGRSGCGANATNPDPGPSSEAGGDG